jgi:hypothetical protein
MGRCGACFDRLGAAGILNESVEKIHKRNLGVELWGEQTMHLKQLHLRRIYFHEITRARPESSPKALKGPPSSFANI